jgi:hypothetical protein
MSITSSSFSLSSIIDNIRKKSKNKNIKKKKTQDSENNNDLSDCAKSDTSKSDCEPYCHPSTSLGCMYEVDNSPIYSGANQKSSICQHPTDIDVVNTVMQFNTYHFKKNNGYNHIRRSFNNDNTNHCLFASTHSI